MSKNIIYLENMTSSLLYIKNIGAKMDLFYLRRIAKTDPGILIAYLDNFLEIEVVYAECF